MAYLAHTRKIHREGVFHHGLVLPLEMVDNSIGPGELFSGRFSLHSLGQGGYIMLRSTCLNLFSPSLSLLLLFPRAPSHVLHVPMRTYGPGDKGWHSTSCAVHRRWFFPLP